MLSLLQIKNFALIDELSIEFDKGLNVLTGETGAGKSIILDAIDIVLGGKVNNRLIRQGANQAMIEAAFQVNPTVMQWLQEQAIEPLDDDIVVCSRELSVGGEALRSRSRVNGVLVNRQLISQLRDHLVEITVQGETVQLMMPEMQRELLDLYGADSLLQQRQVVELAYQGYQDWEKALDKRRQSEQERLQRLDLLEYQLKELQEAELVHGEELDELEQERDRLSHVVELQQLSYQLYQLLYQNDQEESAITDLLGKAESMAIDMVNYDKEIESVLEMIRAALTQVVEAGQQIHAYGDRLEADPDHLREVEARIILLKRICRKYGPSLAEVITYYQKLQQELAELNNSAHSIEALEKEYQLAQEKLQQACQKLTELRQKAATKLEKQLVQALKPLAMEKVVFNCRLTPCSPRVNGADSVVFYFSPNPGEKIQPLSSTASGGEMSRFLLALKACFSQLEKGLRTLIFDEIDAGVSGKVAQAIAEKLAQLSQKNQILCVTHQPLIAAMADRHFRVDKQMVEETPLFNPNNNGHLNLPEIRTVVRVTCLNDGKTRQQELAQLTGGHSAQEAMAFAESLLAKAAIHRQGNKPKN